MDVQVLADQQRIVDTGFNLKDLQKTMVGRDGWLVRKVCATSASWLGVLVWFLCLMAYQLFLGYLMPKPFS